MLMTYLYVNAIAIFLHVTSGNKWNPVDPIWKHPNGAGTIYVGNQTAAESLDVLRGIGVTHVVNCTVGSSQIPNFHEGKPGSPIKYYRFPISFWSNHVDNSDASVVAFVTPVFAFIEDAVAKGENVLIHCLAGAHRAGPTGCAVLMYFAGIFYNIYVYNVCMKCNISDRLLNIDIMIFIFMKYLLYIYIYLYI
jgi:hypothetical protein